MKCGISEEKKNIITWQKYICVIKISSLMGTAFLAKSSGVVHSSVVKCLLCYDKTNLTKANQVFEPTRNNRQNISNWKNW